MYKEKIATSTLVSIFFIKPEILRHIQTLRDYIFNINALGRLWSITELWTLKDYDKRI